MRTPDQAISTTGPRHASTTKRPRTHLRRGATVIAAAAALTGLGSLPAFAAADMSGGQWSVPNSSPYWVSGHQSANVIDVKWDQNSTLFGLIPTDGEHATITNNSDVAHIVQLHWAEKNMVNGANADNTQQATIASGASHDTTDNNAVGLTRIQDLGPVPGAIPPPPQLHPAPTPVSWTAPVAPPVQHSAPVVHPVQHATAPVVPAQVMTPPHIIAHPAPHGPAPVQHLADQVRRTAAPATATTHHLLTTVHDTLSALPAAAKKAEATTTTAKAPSAVPETTGQTITSDHGACQATITLDRRPGGHNTVHASFTAEHPGAVCEGYLERWSPTGGWQREYLNKDAQLPHEVSQNAGWSRSHVSTGSYTDGPGDQARVVLWAQGIPGSTVYSQDF